MAFTDRPSTEKVLGGLFLALIIGWAIRFIWAGGVIEYFNPDQRIENVIAASLDKEPGGAVLLRRLEADFPRKHDELLRVLREQAKQDGNSERLAATASTWTRRFFAGHENDFAYAPTPLLDKVITLERDLLTKIAESDVARCDALVVGLPMEAELSSELKQAGARMMEARFEAIRGGRQDQQLRLALNPTDFEAVNQSLVEKGASDDQIMFMSGELNGAVMEPGKPCEAMRMLVDTIIEQPEERRALLIGAYVTEG